MTDLAIQSTANGYDLVLWGRDLLPDDSLRPAVAASLLTDREYAEADDGDRRGWWGDALLADATDRDGSLLWRLARRKRTAQTLADGREYAGQALAWLTNDGIARAVDVAAAWDARGHLQLDVTVHRPTGIERYRLAELWQQSLGPGPAAEAAATAGRMAELTADFEHIWYRALPELAA